MASVPPPLNVPPGWTALQIGGHLHTLRILFYVYGGIQLALSVVLLMGALGGYISESRNPTAGMSPVLLAAILAVAALAIGALGMLSLTAANRLGQRRQRTLCLVAAAAACLGGALGIALGVYALIVLLRADVAASFTEPGGAVVA